MVESLQTGAQLTQVVEVDVTAIARLRDAAKADFLAREGVKLSYLPFFAKAAIDALKEHPKLNATIDTEAGEVTYYDASTSRSPWTPRRACSPRWSRTPATCRSPGWPRRSPTSPSAPAPTRSAPTSCAAARSRSPTSAASVRSGTPRSSTSRRWRSSAPAPWSSDAVVIDDADLGETIAVRHMVYLALTYDHRLVDGADAGRFLQDVKKRLEAGQFEV